MFWRLTAQRLLVERKAGDVIQNLRRLVIEGGFPAVHAFWTLQGLGKLDREIHQAALLSQHASLRKNAVKALGISDEDIQLFFDTAVVAASDLHVRREAFVKMSHFPKHPAMEIAIPQLYRDEINRKDEWLSLALKTVAQNQGVSAFKTALGPNLVPNPSFEIFEDENPVGWGAHAYNDRGGTVFTDEVTPEFVRNGKRSLKIQ